MQCGIGRYGLGNQRVLGTEASIGLKGCWCLRTPKAMWRSLRFDGAADSEVMEFSVFKDCDPRLKGFTPTPSDGGRHVKSFTQESVADFGDAGFAIKGVTGTAFGGSQSGIGPQLPSRLELFTS